LRSFPAPGGLRIVTLVNNDAQEQQGPVLGLFLSVVLFKLATMNVPQQLPVSPVSPDQAIAGLAAARHGVFTWDQALACGMSPEMVRTRVATGRWERLSKGVYRLAGATATWRQGLLATTFAAGEDAVASHLAAAQLHRLPAGQACLEITVPRGRRFRREDVIAHESTLLPAVDVQRVAFP
jgi:hypothetical protein